MTKPQSMIAAFFCTFIWGTTFIAQDTGMELIGPYVFNATRSVSYTHLTLPTKA